MQSSITVSKTSVVLLIFGLLIGAGAGYYMTNNSLRPIIYKLEADLDDLTLEVSDLTSSIVTLENQNSEQILEIQTLESELTNALQIIYELETSNAELSTALGLALKNFNDTVARIVKFEEENRYECDENEYSYTLLLMESFENVPVGSLPVDWVIISGSEFDTIYTQSDRAYTGNKGLLLNENGGDDENSIISIGSIEGCQSLVIDMMFSLEGGSADRGVFQFLDENDIGITVIGCLLDMSWQIRLPSGFRDIIGLPEPESNRWYHVEIIIDGIIQKIKVIIDGKSSDWFEPLIPWDTIGYVTFQGNCNYPADLYFDDVYIFKIQ